MKKYLAGILVVMLAFMLCACGDDDEEASQDVAADNVPVVEAADTAADESGEKTEAEDTGSAGAEASDNVPVVETVDNVPVVEADDSSGIVVETIDDGEYSVELTIPSNYVDEETTQDSLDANLPSGVKSATIDAEGNITYVMTKKAHEKMLKDVAEEIEKALEEMVSSGDYPSFREIEHNRDFTEFTVKVDAKELDMAEAMSTLGFIIFGEQYNAYSGSEADNISVKYVNINSGDVIEQADSRDFEL